jgi:hypothetical protein
MKRIIRYFQRGWAAWAVLLLLVSACSKEGLDYVPGGRFDYSNTGPAYNDLAIGTLRSLEGVRYVRLDASTVGMIVNPDEVKHISDGTRVFLQYRCVVLNTTLPEFCTDAILVEWADPLNVGEIVTEPQDRPGDPMSVILDWMTCLEDGFVTLHYSVPSRGNASHGFCLCPGAAENEFRLIHDAHGDNEGDLSDGLICFDVSSLLPDTGGETVTLSLTYLNLDKTSKTLTVDYRSPQ